MPQALDVCERIDDFVMGQGVAERRHPALEAWGSRYRPSFPHYAVEDAIGVVPRVAIAVQGRRAQSAIIVSDSPIRGALPHSAVAYRAMHFECAGAGIW